MRAIYLSLVITQIVYLGVLLLIPGLADLRSGSVATTAAVLTGLLSLSILAVLGRRPLPSDDPQRLAEVFRGLFFLRLAVSQIPVLVGLVGYLMAGDLPALFLLGRES